jgi:hypothetical protein
MVTIGRFIAVVSLSLIVWAVQINHNVVSSLGERNAGMSWRVAGMKRPALPATL